MRTHTHTLYIMFHSKSNSRFSNENIFHSSILCRTVIIFGFKRTKIILLYNKT